MNASTPMHPLPSPTHTSVAADASAVGASAAGVSPPRLSAATFTAAVAAVPLVSIDLCLVDPDGRLLMGWRRNVPAQGTWFTPGGSIRKNEPWRAALRRVAQTELGLSERWLEGAQLMGIWDHFYPDSAYDDRVSTHYVNLPHRLLLSPQAMSELQLEGVQDDQHSHWRWFPLAAAASDPAVHPYAQAYARWLMAPSGVAA